jgi:lipopolysaccharide transport system permease protein
MNESSDTLAEKKACDRWTLIINPVATLHDLNLKGVWQYRYLIYLFVKRDFVARFKQTILGPLWFIIQPLLTTVMFTVVFGKIANIPTDGLPKILFYMTGIVSWTYFSSCLNATSTTFVSNASLFGKVYFPRLTIPLSVVISNLATFLIQFVLLLGFMVYFWIKGAQISLNAYVLLLPFLLALMAGMGLGFGIIVSSLTTKYRDLTCLVAFGVQLWMYATPIVYPVSFLPENYKNIIMLNPLAPIIETFRFALLGVGTFSFLYLAYSFVFTTVILFVGLLLFNRVEKTFMDTV